VGCFFHQGSALGIARSVAVQIENLPLWRKAGLRGKHDIVEARIVLLQYVQHVFPRIVEFEDEGSWL
jgi:hypothetical protein